MQEIKKFTHTILSIWYVHLVLANKLGSDSAWNGQVSEGNSGELSPIQCEENLPAVAD